MRRERGLSWVGERKRAWQLLTALAVVIAGGGSASASGILVARFGGEHGHPTTDDMSALYYNPAGLALRPGKLRINMNGVFAYRWARYRRPEGAIDSVVPDGMTGTGTPASAVGVNSGDASLLNFVVSPFIALASDFGVDNLGVAAGFHVPLGGSASWSQNEAYKDSTVYPGAVDGVQRWTTIDGTIRSLYGTLAAAYYIPKAHLSIGLAGNLVINQVSTVRARNANGTDDVVTSRGGVQEGRSLLEASQITGSLGAGIVITPTKSSWIGLSYQSQPGFGENTLSGTLKNKLGASPVSNQEIEILQSMPDVLRLGLRYRPAPEIELRLFGEYVRWSVLDRQCILDRNNANRKCALKPDGTIDTANGGQGIILAIPRDWQDAGGARFGFSYFLKPEMELYFGAGYDSNAVPDSTLEASMMDMDKATFSFGGRFEMLKRRLAIAATWTQVAYVQRTVAPRGRDPMTGRQLSPMPPSKNPDGGGRYDQSIGLLSLTLEVLAY